MKRPSPSQMDEQQSPRKVRGGRQSADRLHVSICLIANGLTDLSSREPMAELTALNSDQLMKCSKYFEVCLSERWANPNSSVPSMEFDLQMIRGLQVASYIDCFSRMDNPLRKDFKDVKSSLELLRVASQIEFDELISSIYKYLSTILWSDEDELRLRQYSSSPDFRSSQAQDLVARLELGESQAEIRNRSSALMQHCIQTALRCKTKCNRCPRQNFASARSLLEVFFESIGQSGSSDFDTDMVMIVSKEARAMLLDFHEECIRAASDVGDKVYRGVVYKVPGFAHKLEAVCWVLKVLVRAKVADQVVDCFLQLEHYPLILAAVADPNNPASSTGFIDAILDFARLIWRIHKEVVVGNVLVGIPARLALLERWKLLQIFPEASRKAVILSWGYARTVEDVFSTLPSRLRMRLVRRRRFDCDGLISPSALVTLVKRNWAAAEEYPAFLEAEEESESD